ncbi:MAG TPA: PTS sugar transporter subunit IIA [Candidatus Binataceae bacterium]|nr:PTS sugar transporter subunit IIA [Candidatus Binataceae bacterium]
MKITDILNPEMVLPELKGANKADVLRELAAYLVSKHGALDAEMLAAVLAERERLGSTAIGDGIAIPHGKIAGIDHIIGIFGRHRRGVDFDSLDGRPTHLFFLLVAPEDSASLHLKALARVSRLMKDAGFRTRLMNASDAPEIFRLIKEEDARH